MGYEHDMDDYYEEQREKEHMKRRYKIEREYEQYPNEYDEIIETYKN